MTDLKYALLREGTGTDWSLGGAQSVTYPITFIRYNDLDACAKYFCKRRPVWFVNDDQVAIDMINEYMERL